MITTSTLFFSMAKSKNLASIFTITIHTLLFSLATATNSSPFHRSISPTLLGLEKEKLSHLHFFFHDFASGPKPTSMRVAQAKTTNTSLSSFTFFGAVVMLDDQLTVGPEPESKVVCKAQGMWGSAAQDENALAMIINLAFTEGKYNGSSVSMLGRNAVLSKVREMAIVGGSGAFRFARGYAQAKTHSFDSKTRNAVVEYNVIVFHY